MDLRVLSYFLVVAREENITKAAEVLNLTQPTLSRQLKQLEEELGVSLFKRGKHNISLTEEGMIFRRRAQELVSFADKIKKEVSTASSEMTGEISIGCNETESMNTLSSLIAQFRNGHPLVSFHLRSGNNADIREYLEQGLIDIGLLTEPVDATKFRYVRLPHKEQWGILVRTDSEFAGVDGVTNRDLAGVPMITIQDETIHSELTLWAGKYAKKMLPIAHYNLLSAAASLVRETGGVVVCSRPNAIYEGIIFVPLSPKLELSSILAWKDDQKFSKAAAAFIDDIQEIHKMES